MTELALNILWLSIAVFATATWRLSWARERAGHSRQNAYEFTALACVLVLLFFAVSLTDDLHQDILLSDACSSTRRDGGTAVRSSHQGANAQNHVVLGLPEVSFGVPTPAPAELFAVACEASSSPVRVTESSGRAPPSL